MAPKKGSTFKNKKSWTSEEDELLGQLRMNFIPLEDLSAKLGRSKSAINHRVNILKLPPMPILKGSESPYWKGGQEAKRARNKRYRDKNKDILSQKAKEFRSNNLEEMRKRGRGYSLKWILKHRAKWMAAKLLRLRRIKDSNIVDFSQDQLSQRMSMFFGCWMCGGPKETIDHVIPLNKGGWHILSNLRPACKSCNSSKQDKWPFDTSVVTNSMCWGVKL